MIGLILRYRVQLAGLLLVGILLGVGLLVWGPPLAGAPPGALEVALPAQTITPAAAVRLAGAIVLTPAPATPAPPTLAPAALKVYVTGAIAHPGVYALIEGDRIEDAVRAAGGALADADLDSLNLSARVQDEEQIRVPHRGDNAATPTLITPTAAPAVAAAPAAGAAAPAAAGSAPAALPAAHSINVNRADAVTLAALPGIGPVLAGRIIAYRTAHGPFAQVQDVKLVSGIGDAILAKITPYITTGP